MWGVLYDPTSHDIRVDANQNRDFTDDAVMRPYREKYDVGHFGTDNQATPVVESMPFVVEYREDVDASPLGIGTVDYINIGIPEGLHGSHVAGITAANDMLGNRDFDGQAPGAKIVSARACSWGGGCTAAALTTGMVDLVVNRHVDVVNVSIGGLPAQNDGNNARAQLYDKLIKDYGVQLFISAQQLRPGCQHGRRPVGRHRRRQRGGQRQQGHLARQLRLGREEGERTLQLLLPGSARGRRLQAQPHRTGFGDLHGQHLAERVECPGGRLHAADRLPDGERHVDGLPQATGGAALLLSAAKATDRGITPAQLRRALYTSANKIKDVSVAAQGNGLMDVNGAWSLLARKVEARTYTSSAPVCTPFSDGFATPGQGVGIHNRCAAGKGGLKAGQFKTYNLKLTRTSGAKAAVLHRLSVVGDKRAFHVQPLVLLPLDKTVTVPVLVTPGPGLNSAIIEVDDPLTSVTDFEVLNTVVTGAEPAKPAYEIDAEATVDRNSSTSYFITVPEGATALQVDLSGIATGSQTRWIAINPWGVPVESTSSLACYSNFSDAAACKPQERAYENPMPGVWELEVESRRTSPMLHNPYELIAKVQGVTVNPATVELPSVTAGTATPVTWSVKNNFGPLNLTATGGALGSALTERPTIADGTGQEYTVEVLGWRAATRRGHRQRQRRGSRPRPLGLPRHHAGRTVGGRRLRGICVDPEPGG
nr:hypothetical protein GCM10020092_106730 [Actinoplanes digitatis]